MSAGPLVAAHQLHLGAEHRVHGGREFQVRRARRAGDHLLVEQVLGAVERRRVPGEAAGDLVVGAAEPGELLAVELHRRVPNTGSTAAQPAITPSSEPSFGDTL